MTDDFATGWAARRAGRPRSARCTVRGSAGGRPSVATRPPQAGFRVHAAKFHLDRLVDEGLLEVEFRRLSAGAGRVPVGPQSYIGAPPGSVGRCPTATTTWRGRILADGRGRCDDFGRAGGQTCAAGRGSGDQGTRARRGGPPRSPRFGASDGLPEPSRRAAPLGRVADGTLALRNCRFHPVAQEPGDLVLSAQPRVRRRRPRGRRAGADVREVPQRSVPGGSCVTARASNLGLHDDHPRPDRRSPPEAVDRRTHVRGRASGRRPAKVLVQAR